MTDRESDLLKRIKLLNERISSQIKMYSLLDKNLKSHFSEGLLEGLAQAKGIVLSTFADELGLSGKPPDDPGDNETGGM